MLPNITLQLGELTSSDTNANDLALVPEGADSLEANFAEILHRNAGVEIAGDPASGMLLPLGGNDLPLLTFSTQPSEATPELEAVLDLTVPVQPDLDLVSIATSNSSQIESELRPALLLGEEHMKTAATTHDEPNLLVAVQDLPSKNTRQIHAVLAAPGPALSANAAELVRDPALPRINVDMRRETTLDRVTNRETNRNALTSQVVQIRDLVIQEKPASRPTEFLVPVSVTSETSVKTSTDDLQLPVKPFLATAGQTTLANVDLGAVASTAARLTAEAPSLVVSQSLTETIKLPVQEAGWDRAISERVLLMANGKLQNAEIRLTPAELGPLRVQVAVEDGAANVSFQVQHALTREAIEQALPRLRELFAEQGLSLGQTQVSDEGSRHGLRDDPGQADASETVIEHADVDDEQDVAPSHGSELGLLDTFV